MTKTQVLIFAVILSIGFLLRIHQIERPLADWHSWRQADTAAVARNFAKEGYNPFVPKYDDMSSQANGLDNPNRYRFVEFPIYNTLVFIVWKITGISVLTARLVTVLISLGSTALLFIVVRYLSGFKIAALSAFFFATIPFNVFYSSTILPGPLMVFALLALYWSFIKWLANEKKWQWGIASILFANLAILTWPIALLFMLPVIYLAFEKHGLDMFKKPNLWFFTIASLAPFIAWRFWMMNFPEGIPNWRFLLNEGDIRFKGAFFRWLIAERMAKLILAFGGFVLFTFGLITRQGNRERFFYYSWLAAIVIYFIIFASGNVRHDYYQVPFVPIAAIFMAKGTALLFNLPAASFNRFLGPIAALVLVILMWAFGYFEVRGFYWINRPAIVTAGQAADRILPRDAIVIAPYNGDAAFLYQINRKGYPVVDRPLEELVDLGARHFVSVDVGDPGIQNLIRSCRPIQVTPDYVILELFRECIGR